MGVEVIMSNPGELPSIPEPAGRVQLPLPLCVQAAPSARPCPIKEASSPKEKPSWAESQPPPCESPRQREVARFAVHGTLRFAVCIV